MASVPHNYYSDNNTYVFTTTTTTTNNNNNNEFCELLPTPMSVGSSEEILPYYDNGATNILPCDSDITSSSSMMSIAALPEYERSCYFGVAGTDDHRHGFLTAAAAAAGGYHPRDQEFREECINNIGFSSNLWPPVYHHPNNMNAENYWEIEAGGGRGRVGGVQNKVEEANLKITRYSAEERKDRILRYLKKRSQRNFNKTIKYACRKTLADKRVRIRGRFAKNNNDLCNEDDIESVIKTDQTFQDTIPLHQIKAQEEEYWLQEAISNLMYYHMFPDNSFDPIP